MEGRPGVVSTRGRRPGTVEEFVASISGACLAAECSVITSCGGEAKQGKFNVAQEVASASASATAQPVIIDLRNAEAFARRRLDPTSGLLRDLGIPVAHFDFSEELEGIRCKVNGSLLPARDVPIFLVLSAERTDAQLAWFALESEVNWGDPRRATTRRGWTVSGSIAFSECLDQAVLDPCELLAWTSLRTHGVAVVEGAGSVPVPGSTSFRPRLWRPTEIAPVALAKLCEMDWTSEDNERLLGADLACGAGRDGVYILEELNALQPHRGGCWQWAFIDHLKGGGERLCALAASRSLSPNAALWVTADLKKEGSLEEIMKNLIEESCAGLFPERRLGCVTMSRFLHRPLLLALRASIERHASARGCVLGVVHFEGLEACLAWGHPKSPRDVLGDDELATEVESWGPGWTIDHNALPLAPDRIRSVRVFLATYTPRG